MARLILVEDEFSIAKDIQSRLRGTGYDIVGVAATGEDAIAQAGELRPDVVLMDIVLKGEMDGIDAAQQIIERFDIPIIFLTAHTDAATVKRATATASYGFLVKPFDVLELTAAVDMAIHGHGMEAKARESDRRIRELTESLSEMIFETDLLGNITFINDAGLKEFGYTKEQVEGVTLYDLVSPEKREEAREAIAQATISEPSKWMEVPGVRRDGSTFPVSVHGSLIIREGVPVGTRGIALNVTERKRAEQKLEESEKRIRELTDALPEIIFETDANGIITFANETPFARYGYTKEEIEGKMNLLDFVAPFDRERIRETISKRIQGEDRGWVEYALMKKDGSTAPFDVRSMLIVRDGVFEGFRGIAIDITERKRAEAALIRSERHIRELTDALPVVVYEADETGRFTFANATAFDMFGYTKEELEAGMSVFQVVVDADKERARTVFRRRGSGGDVGRVEYTGLRKDGSTFPFSNHGAAIRRDGAVVGVRGVAVDITELKRAEEKVKEHTHTIEILNRIMTEGNQAASVESFAETVTNLTLELLHFDAGTIHLVDADARCAKLRYVTGIPDAAAEAIREIPLDETPYAGFLVETKPLFVDGHEVSRVPHVAELGLESLAVVPLIRHDERIGALNVGSFKPYTFSQAEKVLLTTIGYEAAVVIAKLQSDELIRAALKERETLLADLQRSNAELEQFAHVTSHDLQEPLRMITSYMQIIEEDYKGKLDADADQYIAFTVDGAKRMHALINDLLAYSRVGTRGEPFMPTSMNSVLSKAIANLEVAIEESHAVITHDQLPTVLGDESQLIQLFQNLIGNAIKFRGDDAPMIHVGVEETKAGWVFSVSDNGIGIDMRYAERIFAVFQRLHAREDYPGTGIGLAAVKKIVERHGGRIWVESEPAKGSTFHFTLPRRGDSMV